MANLGTEGSIGQVAPTYQDPPSYSIGPPPAQSYYHAPPKSVHAAQATAPDQWKDVPGAVHDQARSLVEKFEAALGWPASFNANNAELWLAKSGVNLTASAYDAYEWLFNNLSEDLKKSAPWSRYGLDKDTYQQVVGKFDSVYFDWTGQQLSTQNLGQSGLGWSGTPIWQAIRNSWTPDQIRNYAMYGNASGGTTLLPEAQMGGSMPWLSTGQTYSQTLQQFQSFEEHIPSDSATLAAWFRFGQSAKQVGGGQGASGTVSQKPLQQAVSEVR